MKTSVALVNVTKGFFSRLFETLESKDYLKKPEEEKKIIKKELKEELEEDDQDR